MALEKVTYVDRETTITAKNLNDIQDAVIELEENDTAKGEQISDLEQVTTSTAIGSTAIATFNASAADMPLKELLVNIEPVQAAGTPSPDNPLPITGWTGANVIRTGKNLFGDLVIGKRVAENGDVIDGGSQYWISRTKFSLGANRDLTTTVFDTAGYTGSIGYAAYTADGTLVGTGSLIPAQYTDLPVSNTINFPDSVSYVRFRGYQSGSADSVLESKVQVEFGSVSSDYEPFGTTYSITFPSEAGTVYGGTLDVTNGVLTVDRTNLDLSTKTWAWNGDENWWTTRLPDAKKPQDEQAANMLCSNSKVVAATAIGNELATCIALNSNKTLIYKNFDSANSPTGQLVYELANPIEITLTAQEIDTLLGTNNIWADCGDISATYGAYLEIENARINELEEVQSETLQATRSTTLGPISIATFNASAADMPIKSLTVNIKPAQSGTGDPSPENVRPITAWTGAKVMRTGKNLYNVSFSNQTFRGITFLNNNGVVNASGVATMNHAVTLFNFGETFLKAGTYIFSGNPNTTKSASGRLTLYNKTRSYSVIGIVGTDAPELQFTLSEDSIVVATLVIASGAQIDGYTYYPMIRLASDADQTFEPYGDTYEIVFPTEAGIVGAGTLDVTNGVLTIDSVYCETNAEGKLVRYLPGGEPTTTSCVWMTSYAYYGIPQIVRAFSPGSVQGCNRYGTTNGQGVVTADNHCEIRIHENYTRLTFKQTSIPGWGTEGFTRDNIEAYFAENPLQVVIPLATPYSIQLTPIEVATLLGTNNIWADCGDVTVTYGAYLETVKEHADELGNSILSAIAPLETTYTASRAYTVGSYLFVGTKFYKVTSAIQTGGTINPGTNVAQTTVAGQLMTPAVKPAILG